MHFRVRNIGTATERRMEERHQLNLDEWQGFHDRVENARIGGNNAVQRLQQVTDELRRVANDR